MFNKLLFEDDINFYFKIFQEFKCTVVIHFNEKNMKNINNLLNSVKLIIFIKEKNDTFFF